MGVFLLPEYHICKVWFIKYLDRGTDPVILLKLIKGSNLRLEICVCSVVSTVETSGAAGKWWDFYCIFCCAIRVSFFISFYQKNPLLHKKITVGEYLQKRRQALSSIVAIVLPFGTQKMAKEHSSCNWCGRFGTKTSFGLQYFM